VQLDSSPVCQGAASPAAALPLPADNSTWNHLAHAGWTPEHIASTRAPSDLDHRVNLPKRLQIGGRPGWIEGLRTGSLGGPGATRSTRRHPAALSALPLGCPHRRCGPLLKTTLYAERLDCKPKPDRAGRARYGPTGDWIRPLFAQPLWAHITSVEPR